MVDLHGMINEDASISNLLGLSPGSARLGGYEGAQLPSTTWTAADHGAVPWNPDSPLFWGVVLAGVTAAALLGAHVGAEVRVGHARIRGEAGDD